MGKRSKGLSNHYTTPSSVSAMAFPTILAPCPVSLFSFLLTRTTTTRSVIAHHKHLQTKAILTAPSISGKLPRAQAARAISGVKRKRRSREPAELLEEIALVGGDSLARVHSLVVCSGYGVDQRYALRGTNEKH